MLTLLFHLVSSSALAAEPTLDRNDADPTGAGMPLVAVADDDEDEDDDDDDVRGFAGVASELGLSAEQKTKIQELIYVAKTTRIDQKAKAAKARLELKQLLTATALDEKSVNKALETFIAAEGELQRGKIKLLMDMRKQLTAEQWARLVELREARSTERKERRREHHGGDDD